MTLSAKARKDHNEYQAADSLLQSAVDDAYTEVRKLFVERGFSVANNDTAEEFVAAIYAYLRDSAEPDELPFGDEPVQPDPLVNPEREARALLLAKQWASVDVAKEHERDLRDWHEGRMIEAEYRRREAERDAYVDNVKVFFNYMAGEYCVETVRFEDLRCRCGMPNPGDPCESCGKLQPLNSSDYDRANLCEVSGIDEHLKAFPPVSL